MNEKILEEVMNPEYVKANVRRRVINTERNREYLKGKPHRELLDLSIIYEIDVTDPTGGFWVAVLTDAMVEHLGLTEAELYASANGNENIVYDTLTNYIYDDHIEETKDATILFVTIERKPHGACAILHKETLSEIAEMWGDDLIICPSSVHEIIVLPANFSDDRAAMLDIVKSVNATEVRPEDFLSDNVYYFDRATTEVEMM